MNKVLKFLLPSFYILLIIYFYIFNLGFENINEDQYRWYNRTDNFFEASSSGNYANTYQQYHPGISFIYFLKLGEEIFKFKTGLQFDSFTQIPYNLFPSFNFYTKIVLVTFNLFLLGLLFYLVRNLFSKFTTFIFLLGLSFDTYFIGLTRNLHMDSLLALLIAVSIISFYNYCVTKNTKFLIISIIFSGIGFLTKSVFLLVPIFQFGIASYFTFKEKNNFLYFKGLILNTFLGFLLFIVFFPAMWVAPFQTLQKIFIDGALNTGLSGEDNFMHYVNGLEITNPGPKFYFYVLTYRLSPFFIFTFTLLSITGLINLTKNKFRIKFENPLIIFSVLFCLVYLAIILYSPKKTDRYISVLYPFLYLILAYYLEKIWTQFKNFWPKIFISTFLFITLIFNFLIHPYYFAFYDPIFGGIDTAKSKIYINQGGITYLEIIEYIDSLYLSQDKKVGAINDAELTYSSRTHIGGLRYYDYFKKDYQILPLQRGDNFISNSTKVKSINIMGQEYFRIYKLNDK